MTPLQRGLALAVAQLALVASLGAKLLQERATYPRAWVRVAPVDPALPLRGRYVQLSLIPQGAPDEPARALTPRERRTPAGIDPFRPNRGGLAAIYGHEPRHHYGAVTLLVRNGQLVAVPDLDEERPFGASGVYLWDTDPEPTLSPPVLFFIPEHVPDPSQRKPGEELWAEVTVPPKGPPRPLRLGVRRGSGPIVPL